MTKGIKWVDSHIEVEPIKRNKKITGTRLGAILGLNRWATPFATWCEITKTYQEPFEDTIYTLAGKAIEPIIIEYLKTHLFLDLESPEDVYGAEPFKKTFGDFYKSIEVFGGMWDARSRDGKTIVEIKTTKRSEDWVEDVPEYYKIQGALYAFLSGCEQVIFPCAFLTEDDYKEPEKFKPVLGKNFVIYSYKLDDIYPDFDGNQLQQARDFWQAHVLTGISPDFDPVADKEIIAALRKEELPESEDVTDNLKRIDELQVELAKLYDAVKPLEDELDSRIKQLKQTMTQELSNNENLDKVEVSSNRYRWTLTKNTTTTVNKKALEADGLLEKYCTRSIGYRLTNKIIKDEKE